MKVEWGNKWFIYKEWVVKGDYVIGCVIMLWVFMWILVMVMLIMLVIL